MIDLGEQPTPTTEPAEPPPGGVDAVEDTQFDTTPVVPDLTRVGNTASKDEVPDELTEPEPTEDGASTDGASEPEREAPA
ncbi:hypothetical protein [Nocardioides cynanchi]|uniref:hypothetical protein n=1 Tax=Nocardioides cynanchi TaxID=2558918 RepID=UPI0012461520|nr:hypothetical protein [Nocardioides cynanchi]